MLVKGAVIRQIFKREPLPRLLHDPEVDILDGTARHLPTRQADHLVCIVLARKTELHHDD